MTAQFSDIVLFNNKEFDIAGISGDGLFNPYEHGLNPVGTCSGCWRGYVCTYAIKDGKLFLHKLQVNHHQEGKSRWFTRKIKLNGKKPVAVQDEFDLFDQTFEEVGLEVSFSGGFLIAAGFIQELYVHMGFQDAWKYEEVYEIVFNKGLLVQQHDVSDKMKEIREKMKTDPVDYDSLEEWISKCFSLDYNL